MRKRTILASAGLPEKQMTMSGPRVGWIAPGSKPGDIRVDYPGNAAGPLPARSTIPFDAHDVARAVAEHSEVVLFFEGNDPRLPLLMGVVQARPETPLLDAILGDAARGTPVEATVDRKRLVFEGQEEIVLRCGKSSITLQPSGKVVIRGAYVETHAEGTNRIKGGVVKIN